jgi:hypothetical protein
VSLTCRDVGERLLLYRDGALPPSETEWLREHLHQCPNCLTLLDNYDSVVQVLERLRPVQLPADTLEQIKKRLEGGGPHEGCCG